MVQLMSPIPYDSQTDTGAQFRCPDCSRALTAASGEMTCPDCGYVPKHGSD